MVSSTPRPHFTPGKDPVPILQEAGWAPGPVWTGGKSCPHRDSIPDRPARSQSLYRLSYPTHTPKPGWTDGKSRPHRDSIPDRPARSQSLCRLSYPALTMYVPGIKLFHHSRQCLFRNTLHSHRCLVSYLRVAFDMSAMLSDFIRDGNMSTYFSRTPHYKISLKFIEQFLNCYKRTSRCVAASRRIFAHFLCARYRNVQLCLYMRNMHAMMHNGVDVKHQVVIREVSGSNVVLFTAYPIRGI